MDLIRYPKRYYDYNSFLRERFDARVHKISLDAGFTCPNIDGSAGYGGCVYCNNQSFSPGARLVSKSVTEQMQIGMEIARHRTRAQKFIAYFQAHTNTYAPVARLQQVYGEALAFPEVVGIAIGTRPDAVDPEKIALLERLAQTSFVSIEYGVQSIDNQVLRQIHRGHTYEDFLTAMAITRDRGIHICAHVMLGFPGQTRAEMLQMAQAMNLARIDAIKIHNLIVTRDTELARQYVKTPFPVLGYSEYVELVCDFLEKLAATIVVERLCATTSQQYLIAPLWNKSPGDLSQDITATLTARQSWQGKRSELFTAT